MTPFIFAPALNAVYVVDDDTEITSQAFKRHGKRVPLGRSVPFTMSGRIMPEIDLDQNPTVRSAFDALLVALKLSEGT